MSVSARISLLGDGNKATDERPGKTVSDMIADLEKAMEEDARRLGFPVA